MEERFLVFAGIVAAGWLCSLCSSAGGLIHPVNLEDLM